VVTGIGCVGPNGMGLKPLAEALRRGQQPLAVVDRSRGYHRPSGARLAGLMACDSFEPWLSRRTARRMSPASRSAVCAARMALDAAGLSATAEPDGSTAVCLGTSYGSTNYATDLLHQIQDPGPLGISPLLFMETVANAHAGQIALAVGATGPNLTISQREASGLLTLARGADWIRVGRARRVLAGCVDEVSPILHAILDRFGALARSSSTEDLEVARVFDADRNGFVIADGATVLILESAAEAEQRGAATLATVAASARANDPSASVSDWGAGHVQLARRLTGRLKAQGVDLASIDLVVSGASGSRRGDRLEALVLREAFGNDLPVVLAPKAVTGEYGGGFLASAFLALDGIDWAATPGFRRADPELDLTPHAGEPLARPERILVTSLAAGGAACWVVLDRSTA
jgi:3-oxoacyl-[acyl-carrier-protein] synthase II